MGNPLFSWPPQVENPPAPVAEALTTLGSNLKTARLRRNPTEKDVAFKTGVGRKVVADAEKGKPSTSAAVYVAMLWALGLQDGLAQLADPKTDKVGLIGSLMGTRTRGGRTGRDVGFY